MLSENPLYPNFLDKKAPKFAKFTTTLDNLRASGVGADSKHTEGISMDEENLLKSQKSYILVPLRTLACSVFFFFFFFLQWEVFLPQGRARALQSSAFTTKETVLSRPVHVLQKYI